MHTLYRDTAHERGRGLTCGRQWFKLSKYIFVTVVQALPLDQVGCVGLKIKVLRQQASHRNEDLSHETIAYEVNRPTGSEHLLPVPRPWRGKTAAVRNEVPSCRCISMGTLTLINTTVL